MKGNTDFPKTGVPEDLGLVLCFLKGTQFMIVTLYISLLQG